MAAILFSPLVWGQILIPDESPETTAPQKGLFGLKNQQSEVDLQSRDWDSYSLKIQQLELQQQRNGIAYMISSGIVFVGSSIGYTSVDNSLEKGVYSMSQSLAIAAFGYGFYQYQIGSQERLFFQTVENSRTLNRQQKDDLLRTYQAISLEQGKTNRWIQFSTYFAISGLNLWQASREKDKDLKNGLYLLGGITALAAISVHF